MGMRAGELVRKVELPVALPLVLTGLRVSAVQVVATATLGALVGYRNLGTPIVSGFQRSNKGPLLAAAILVALLALFVDGLFALAERRAIPWRRTRGRQADATVGARTGGVDAPVEVPVDAPDDRAGVAGRVATP
jgi:osmoprotectant transport system permease protein